LPEQQTLAVRSVRTMSRIIGFDSVSRRLIDLPEHNRRRTGPRTVREPFAVEDAIQFDQGAGRKTPSRIGVHMRHTYRHSDILETAKALVGQTVSCAVTVTCSSFDESVSSFASSGRSVAQLWRS